MKKSEIYVCFIMTLFLAAFLFLIVKFILPEFTAGREEASPSPVVSSESPETSPSSETPSETDPPETVSSSETDPTETTQPSETSAEITAPFRGFDTDRLIFLGDSRMVGVYCSQVYSQQDYGKHIWDPISEDDSGAVGDNTFVALGGKDLQWLCEYAFNKALSWYGPDAAYVLWFGVNDMVHIDGYIDFVNNTVVPTGVPVFYMTLGPSKPNAPDYLDNDSIIYFNQILLELLDPSVYVIDIYSFITEGIANGTLSYIDTVHYSYQTSAAIYQYVIQEIERILQTDLETP